MTAVSPTQLAVVRWLAAHPDIDISYNPPHGYVMWSLWWRSTPRLTKPTFLALFKRGLLLRTKVLRHDRRVVGQVWGLSARGLDVAREVTHEQ